MGKTKARKEPIEDLTDAVIKIETELGTDPAGSLINVKTFLQTQHQTDGTHKNTHGPHKWIDEQDYANFTSAVAAAPNKTLVIARSISLDANTVIPASVSIMPINPGVIVSNGYTLTINGPVVGNPMHQWLSGFAAGEVTFGVGSIKGVIPDWFQVNTNPGTTDMTLALASSFASMSNPCILLLSETYGHTGFTVSSKYCTVIGAGKDKTIFYRLSGSGEIKFTNCNFSSFSDFTVNQNGGLTGHGVVIDNAATPSTYVDVNRLLFKGHSGAGKYGLYVDGATLSSFNDITFADITGTGSHLYVETSYYSVFKNINMGKSGTDSNNSLGYKIYNSTGLIFNGLYIEEGGNYLAGLIQSSDGITINGLNAEFFAGLNINPSTGIYFKILNCRNININGGVIHEQYSSANQIATFRLDSSFNIKFNNLQFKRTNTTNAEAFILYYDIGGGYPITSHISVEDCSFTGAVACDGVKTGPNTNTDLVLKNNKNAGNYTVTHKPQQTTRLTAINEGCSILINGVSNSVIQNCPNTVHAGEHIERSGNNSIFQNMTIENSSGPLSGATQIITLNIPSDCQIIGVSMNVDTVITGAASWSVAFSGGNILSIGTALAITQNTKKLTLFNLSSQDTRTTSTTHITLTANGGNFTGGVIRASVYYVKLNNLPNI